MTTTNPNRRRTSSQPDRPPRCGWTQPAVGCPGPQLKGQRKQDRQRQPFRGTLEQAYQFLIPGVHAHKMLSRSAVGPVGSATFQRGLGGRNRPNGDGRQLPTVPTSIRPWIPSRAVDQNLMSKFAMKACEAMVGIDEREECVTNGRESSPPHQR